MIYVIVIVTAIALYLSPLLRCATSNLGRVLVYCTKDAFSYIRRKGYNEVQTGELVAYVGLFGKGKTLSAVNRVVSEYHRSNNKRVWCRRRWCFVTQRVKVLSNVELKIEYERLISLEQIVLCAERNEKEDDANGTKTITLVLGDEFSVQLNSREFKKNIDPLFLNTLLTSRHHHISIFYTTQRFQHVDALLRQVTSYVVDCDKLWRFQQLSYYGAWEMENAVNPVLLKPLRRSCWFVRDSDYEAYDTYATVGNLTKTMKAGGMMKDEEIIALRCNQPANMDAVANPSKGWLRRIRGKK
jgi:hypothetical protein